MWQCVYISFFRQPFPTSVYQLLRKIREQNYGNLEVNRGNQPWIPLVGTITCWMCSRLCHVDYLWRDFVQRNRRFLLSYLYDATLALNFWSTSRLCSTGDCIPKHKNCVVIAKWSQSSVKLLPMIQPPIPNSFVCVQNCFTRPPAPIGSSYQTYQTPVTS